MSEHTKTPWAIHDNGYYFEIGVPAPDSSLGVHPTVMIGVDYCNEANARHIVHCVNNHERLVEMVGALLANPSDSFTVHMAESLLSSLEAEKGGEL